MNGLPWHEIAWNWNWPVWIYIYMLIYTHMYLHAVLQNYATAQTEHGLRRLAFEWAQRRLRKNANAKKKNYIRKQKAFAAALITTITLGVPAFFTLIANVNK